MIPGMKNNSRKPCVHRTDIPVQKIVTEKAKEPGSTWKPLGSLRKAAATAHNVQATPIPKKTLTALLPVTLPMLESAYLSWTAATLLANKSMECGVEHSI
uniref:Uncharacterized protein n=1 Tax=Romanomermis culicivorax TaxID=13658 RepID=A0A915L7J6_ROMCU